jgi:hypothetical protein
VTEALLQNVDRTATFEPLHRVEVPQVVEGEVPKFLCLFPCLLGGRGNEPSGSWMR